MRVLPVVVAASVAFVTSACASGTPSGDLTPVATQRSGRDTPASPPAEAVSPEPQAAVTYVPTPALEGCEGSDTYLGGTPIPVQAPGGTFVERNIFCGTLTIDGDPAPDGTAVEAVVDGEVCDRTEVQDGRYTLTVPLGICPPELASGGLAVGKVVTFRVDGETANERARLTAPIFLHQLDLTVGQPSPSAVTVTPTPFGAAPATPLIPCPFRPGPTPEPMQPVPEPNALCGTVTIDGEPAPDGTLVQVLVAGRVCDSDRTEGGEYAVTVFLGRAGQRGVCAPCGGWTATFRVDGRPVQATAALGCPIHWERVNLEMKETDG